MAQQMQTRTFQVESIELRELRAGDLRREAVQLQWATPDASISSEDVAEVLDGISTQEPFRQFPALAFRVTIDGQPVPADVLVATLTARVGIASNADATWGDLRDACDLTTVEGGDAFAAAIRLAINDWLNDAEAWEGRA